jgi:hypothetical protein
MEETTDTKRAFIIANFCEDEEDIERLLGPIEETPSKYADGTIKTKPILREYAIALVKTKNRTNEKNYEEQQKKLAKMERKMLKLEKKLLEQQTQIEELQNQLFKQLKKTDKIIRLFVDDEREMETDFESDTESD